jgi:hypothetical protein
MSVAIRESRPSASFTPGPAAVLRRKCDCGGSGSDCEGCRKKGTLQRSAAGQAEVGMTPRGVYETLRSPGRPLDDAARAFMEPRFGHDFSRVRVHADAGAAESARQIHASAYTLGQHIVFAGGSPSIGNAQGRRLLAHELAHTVQQEGVEAAGASVHVGSPGDVHEHEADAAARAMESAGSPRGARPFAGSRVGSPAAVRRQEENPRRPPEERPEPFEATGAPTVDIPGIGEMEINPTVIGPDIEGVPDFLRGKEVKLSDLRKALDALGLGKRKKAQKGEPTGFCEKFQMERAESGAVEGLCCPKFVRDPRKCCKSTNMDVHQTRCCGPTEVAIGGRCITPQPAPAPGPTKKQTTPAPKPPPAPAPVPVPVSTVLLFEQNQPGTASKDEEGLRKGLTSEGSKQLDMLAKELKDNPTFKVQLTGKASSEGPPWYNLGLAGRRAHLVADVLVGMGVDRSRITEPPDGGSECKKLEDGIHNCGETGASKEIEPNDRQVRAQVFTVP